ncbi:PaREP1 family protein [Thermofilum pendens]|uniref:HEPN domain-containing protein n=1 Tax=Thermofilum pendens (strain DSM 2475 / Hrk 5) TaxID=368408 RepID=A1S060_THEPD|nr:PaREP1 family protein [Thermofilum pendens]ABL78840.1 hypothetical protein Tpen_1443 [Thermofilum pendens Hrk 5]
MSFSEALTKAWKAVELARREVDEYRKDREPLRLRNACEKGWLAVVLATDALLVALGYGKPESYRERRELLGKLEREKPEIARLGLRDRFGARGYYLHVQGYHEGALGADEVAEELEKVERYVGDVERIVESERSAHVERAKA